MTMLVQRRPKIPAAAEEETLFNARHTCCICREKNNDVIIHHIDGNRKNNNLDNLAVVCLECHSKVTGTRGLGKSFKPGEVRRYKRSWDKQVRDSREVSRPKIFYMKELVSQVDFTICRILACDKDKHRQEELLKTLYELHLWRGDKTIDSKIVEGMKHLAIMSGLSYPGLVQLLAEKAWEMCWQFVGPDDVAMDKKDEKHVIKCAEIIEILADFNCQFARGKKATIAISQNAERLFEIGVWYLKESIAKTVLKAYDKGLDGCMEDGKIKFRTGYITLRKSLTRLPDYIESAKSFWRSILSRHGRLLKKHKKI
jgi:hypothetical protein